MQHSVLPQLAVAAAVCQSQLVNGQLSIASLLAQLPNKLISAKVPADTSANLRCLSSILASVQVGLVHTCIKFSCQSQRHLQPQ